MSYRRKRFRRTNRDRADLNLLQMHASTQSTYPKRVSRTRILTFSPRLPSGTRTLAEHEETNVTTEDEEREDVLINLGSEIEHDYLMQENHLEETTEDDNPD